MKYDNKVAIWRTPSNSQDICNEGLNMSDCGWVRITPYVEIDIPELSKDELLKNELSVLDKLEETAKKEVQKAQEAYMDRTLFIQQRRQELLAITHDKSKDDTHVDYACAHGELESACHVYHPEIITDIEPRPYKAPDDDIPF